MRVTNGTFTTTPGFSEPTSREYEYQGRKKEMKRTTVAPIVVNSRGVGMPRPRLATDARRLAAGSTRKDVRQAPQKLANGRLSAPQVGHG